MIVSVKLDVNGFIKSAVGRPYCLYLSPIQEKLTEWVWELTRQSFERLLFER